MNYRNLSPTVVRTALWSGLFAGVLALAAAPVAAQNTEAQTKYPPATVKALVDANKDDQRAMLTGKLVSHEGGDNYTFQDSTGKIKADIDDDVWSGGAKFKADQEVQLAGEFEGDRGEAEFDVDELRVK